jgi:hypothetical protein
MVPGRTSEVKKPGVGVGFFICERCWKLTFVEKGNIHVQIDETGIGIREEEMKGICDPSFINTEFRVQAVFGLFTNLNNTLTPRRKERKELGILRLTNKIRTYFLTVL